MGMVTFMVDRLHITCHSMTIVRVKAVRVIQGQ
jgi:hypothetical protein